jgi:hypothetical protein
MKKPIDAAKDLIDCFRWDLEGAISGNFDEAKVSQGRPLNSEDLIPVVVALRRYVNGEATSLDEAFETKTSLRNDTNRERERDRIRWLVKDFAREFKKTPKKDRPPGISPMDFAKQKVADLFGMTFGKVDDLYNGYR